MEWKGMQKIILEYFSFSCLEVLKEACLGILISLYSLKTSNFHFPRN